jgi:hypothetical protein
MQLTYSEPPLINQQLESLNLHPENTNSELKNINP